MKIVVFVFCLFISMNVSAQSNDVTAVDTTSKSKPKTIYQLYEDIKTQPGTSDPLIMVDDSVYDGDINNIKSDDVTSIDVIKGDDAKEVFGTKAQNGAFIIKTKYYGDRSGTVTGPTRKFSDGPVLYVMDGMLIPEELVTKDDVLIKEVVTGKKLEELESYLNKKLDSAVFITTKKYAILEYQMKFSAFSKEYKTYLAGHQNKDDTFEYEVNGVALDDSYYGNAQKLYKISIESIKRVDFLKNSAYNGFSGKTNIVNILTQN